MTHLRRGPQRGFNLVGPRLRDLRLGRSPRLSQQALSDALRPKGVILDGPALSRLEAGERAICDWELKAILEILEVTWGELFEQAPPGRAS